MRLLSIAIALLVATSGFAAAPDRDTYLDLARKGWVYELRSAMWGRDPATVQMRIHTRALAGAALCVVGEMPHPETRAVLEAFGALVRDVFGKPMPMRFAGTDLDACGTGRTAYLRLYSGRVPLGAFNRDLRRIDDLFGIGLPSDRQMFVSSPAQASTFFGSRGQATHLIVKQPRAGVEPTPLERRFFTSILIEELYQAFSFGMDILHFDRRLAFVSKLEEFPVNLRHMPWESPAFMEGLLKSNPQGLCGFDLFMLHALAAAPVENTNTPELLDFIEARFDDLLLRAAATGTRDEIQSIVDPACSVLD